MRRVHFRGIALNKGYVGLMLGAVVAGLGLGALLASKTTPPPVPVVQASGQFGQSGSQSGSGAGATAGAASGQGQGGAGSFGTVSAKEGDTATVKTQQGDLKVKLTGVKVQKTVDGAADDLKPGTTVVVIGQPGSDGTVTANSIQILPADAVAQTGGQGRGANQTGAQGQGQQAQGQAQGQGQQGQNQGARPVMGTVSALTGDTLTVSGPQGDTKVNVSAAKIQKTVDGSADDVTVGQSVSLVGQAGSDGTFAASAIQMRLAGNQGNRASPAANPQATPEANPGATPATPAKNN